MNRVHSLERGCTLFVSAVQINHLLFYKKSYINSSHRSISVNYARFRNIHNSENLPLVSKYNLWNGSHLYAVDDSTIQIQVSEENLKYFGSNPNKYEKDTPLASISALYDITKDI